MHSHYYHKDTQKEYIDGSLNVSLMYNMYMEKYIEHNYILPNDIFTIEFFKMNLIFNFYTKNDQCSLCETRKHMSESAMKEN